VTTAHASSPKLQSFGSPRFAVARAFKGLTWRRFGVVCLLVFVQAVCRIPLDLSLGKSASYIGEHVLLDFGSMLIVFTPVLLAVIAADNLASKDSRRWSLALAIALGVAIGMALNWSVHALSSDGHFWKAPVAVIGSWVNNCFMAAIATTVYFFVIRENEAHDTLHREQMARLGLEREMTEARLQVMQAQIEPHFLFNTLANVRRLYQVDPPMGRAMLQHLSRYLGAALPQMRESRSTLGRETALTVAYLNIQKIRMGSRLAFDVDIPEALKACAVPPMMLLTLAENAIRHGLVPMPEGGSVRVRARAESGVLTLEVSDTGRGLEESSGSGIGLANIRARLKSLYDSDARLLLANNALRGVTATLELPIATAISTTSPAST
jgi:signal transduction histidine kinase